MQLSNNYNNNNNKDDVKGNDNNNDNDILNKWISLITLWNYCNHINILIRIYLPSWQVD